MVGSKNVIFDPTYKFQGGILFPQRPGRRQGGQGGHRGQGGILKFLLMISRSQTRKLVSVSFEILIGSIVLAI